MEVDFFLWPMLLPLIIPIIYSLYYKKKILEELIIITLAMSLIVVFYWPLSNMFYSTSNIYTKTILFILLPAGLLFLYDKIKSNRSELHEKIFTLENFGITNKKIDKSLLLAFILTPIMLIITFLVFKYFNYSAHNTISYYTGTVYFVESLTEEFLFRGILFIFLASRINIQIAYITSLSSFILMHPQHIPYALIIITITQGVLTLEICRRTKNLIGAWTLHGINRFFTIIILPFIL